ncbi:MAG: TIGR01212 family radical SAM protein [Bacteroidales bacterium]|nr:TIGR01212 family radical SAM protein [Bacteroidales bacterium]MCF8392160.1 TIGR01212 family radical SAM protein [Bacteroidales bacterium]
MNQISEYPWKHERRFNAFSEYIRNRFGSRVQKLTIDAGFTCPNRDGTKGRGGCSYCDNNAFNPSYCEPQKSIAIQIAQGIEFHEKRYNKSTSFMAYFQAFSNTYAELSVLKERYSEALENESVIGIVIGTRPDCVDSEILDYLAELNEKIYVTLEFGIESCYDETLVKINRGHDYKTTRLAFEESRKRGIRTGGHMIIGLPGETREMILNEAEILSELKPDQLKFHQLQMVKGTQMAKDYLKNPGFYHEFKLTVYLELMIEFIERLSPEIVIERIAGETVKQYNLRESWGMRYDIILNKFEKMLEQKNSWQGKFYKAV